jgi:hypothetical protein
MLIGSLREENAAAPECSQSLFAAQIETLIRRVFLENTDYGWALGAEIAAVVRSPMTKSRRRNRSAASSPTARPRGIQWLLVAVLPAIVLLFVFLTGHVSVLTCHRNVRDKSVDGRLVNSFIGLIPFSSTEIRGLKEAQLERVTTRRSASVAYRILLLTDTGIIPTTSFARGGHDRHLKVVSDINENLRDLSLTSFTVRHVGASWFILAPIAVTIASAAVAVFWLVCRVSGFIGARRPAERHDGGR